MDDTRTDLELIAAIDRGDPTAFDALYHRYRDWVLRLACRITGDDADALDVLQDTFSYLLRKFPGFRLTAAFTTFLYPVVRNTAIAIRRKRRRILTGDAGIDTVIAATGADPTCRDDLAAALAALTEPQREVLLMRFVDDMSLDEIATALEIPPGTVKSRIHNAIRILRDDPRSRDYFQPSA